MSLSFQKLEPVTVRDPRTIIDNHRSYAVLKSGSQTTFKQYTTTSIAQTSITFSCPPPSGGVLTDRKVYIYLPVRLTFTGIPAPNETLITVNRDAPRAFPVASSTDTLTLTVNNQSMSINLADIIHPLMHYNTDNDLKNLDYSTTPSYQDQSQQYEDLFLAIRSPLQNYSDSNDGSQNPRGGFPYVIVSNPVQTVAGTTLTAIVDCAFTEPLFLSPLYFGKGNESAFFNVNTIDVNFTFLGQTANRMWSHDPSLVTFLSATHTFGGLLGGPTSFTNNGGNLPLLLFNYITPQENMIFSPNKPISYPYFDILRFPTEQSLTGAGVSSTFQSNNIQLNSIPRRMYIFVRERNSDLYLTTSRTDTFFQINNVSIQFKNKNGLLASASPQQLYHMSVKNHCKMSWNQWSGGPCYAFSNPAPPGGLVGTIGSVLCVEFASDIGLDALQAPGVLSQCMLQVQVQATNISNRSITPSLYIVPILEGVFTVQALGSASTNIGVITAKDVMDSHNKPFLNYKDVEDVNGGDFFSGIKDFASTVNNFLKKFRIVSGLIGRLPLPFSGTVSDIAKHYGYGEGEGEGEGVLEYSPDYGMGEGVRAGVRAGVVKEARKRKTVNRPRAGEALERDELMKRIMY